MTHATTAIAQALHDAHVSADTGSVHKPAMSAHTYFDVQDTIESILHPMLRAMVLGSMAWSIDIACINKARDTFYAARKITTDNGESTTIDKFNEYINSVAELAANEQYSEELGFEQNAGALQELAIMSGLRTKWHDISDTAYAAAKMKNETKTIEELIASERVRTVDGDTSANLEALAAFACRGKADRLPLVTAQLIKEQNARYAQQHKDRQLVAPAVINIINMANYRVAGEDNQQFYQLALETQRRLIISIRAAVIRSMNTLATWRLPAGEYATSVLPDGYDVVDALDVVLNSPKFN